MALPSVNDLKMWVGTLFTKDDWDFNFSQIVSWFADGTSDIVVKSIKASNGIDMDGSQITNLSPAANGTEAVTLDQATTLLNRTSFYYPFSVASGKVDSDGNSAYLQKDSDTQVTVLAGNTNPDLVCVQSDGTMETVTSNTILTVPVTNGTYHIIKEKAQAISITSGSSGLVSIGKKFPAIANIGDYFLNNSVVPFVAYKYTVSGWEEAPFCYLGYVTVNTGVATVTIFDYNYNRFDANASYSSGIMSANWAMPDLENGVSKVNSQVYYTDKGGWLYVISQANASNIINMEVFVGKNDPPTTVISKFYNGDGVNDGASCFVPIPAGYYYKYATNDSYGQVGVFYEFKGGH